MSGGSSYPSAPEWPFAPDASPYHVKGVVYRALTGFIDGELGRERYLLEVPDPRLREFIAKPFLAASWYDLGPLVALDAVAARLAGLSPAEFTRVRTIVQAEQDLRGVYNFVLKVLSPLAVARTLPRLTARYFDWGAVEIREHGPRSVEAVRTGVPTYFADWHSHSSLEYLRVALAKAGAQELDLQMTTEPRPRSNGVTICDVHFHLRWG